MACEFVKPVNLPTASAVCFVTKIKNSRENCRIFNLQNKTNRSFYKWLHRVHQFTVVEVVEMAESYVKNGKNHGFDLRKREHLELLLIYMRLRRVFAQVNKKETTAATGMCELGVNPQNLKFTKFSC